MHYLLILLAVSLLVSAVGWISALAIATALIFHDVLSAPTVALCAAMFVFGFRLGGYLFYRERKAAAYRKILYEPSLQKKKPIFVVITVWLFCGLLYVGQVSPVAFRLANTADGVAVNDLWAWIGFSMIVLGTCLEAGADAQKNAAKKKNPKRFVDTGLYRIVRCPNYLGELTIWTGALISGIGAGLNWWQWLIVLVGYAGIVYVMFSGARRLEVRQNEVYGADPEYQAYIRKVPIILPFVPIYSVERHKWLVA